MMGRKLSLTQTIGEKVTNHPKSVVIGFVLITLLIATQLPGLDTDVSTEDYFPESEVIIASDLIYETFPSEEQAIYIVVEANDGDILNQNELIEIQEIENAIRIDDEVQEYLAENLPNAVFSISDAVASVLPGGNLENATPEQISYAIDLVLQDQEVSALISQDSNRFALILVRLRWNPEERGGLAVKLAAHKIEPDSVKVSVAAGFIEEMQEASMETFGTLLPVMIVLIVIILYLSLRRIGDVLLIFLCIPIILIWMFGISASLGLAFSQFMYVAPLLIIAIGIDDGIHVLQRYREEKRSRTRPGYAMASSVKYVGAALVLTTITTVAAFFSNGISSISAIRDFGITVGLGFISTFVIMTMFLPALRILTDRTRLSNRKNTKKSEVSKETSGKGNPSILSKTVLKLASKPLLIIAVVILLTIPSVYGAAQLEPRLKLRELVKDDSEIIYAWETINEHFSGAEFEFAQILVKGEVTSPAVLVAMEETVGNMEDDKHVVKIDNAVVVDYIVPYLKEVMDNETVVQLLEITDDDNNGIPDSSAGVKKIFDYFFDNGDPSLAKAIMHTLHRSENGEYDMTVIWVSVRDTMGTTNQKKLKDELESDSAPLEDVSYISSIVTGESVKNYELLTEMTNSMAGSFVISIIVCAIFLVSAFASIRFGLASVATVALVAAWILGTMFFMGFYLNVVTVTIAAITIGVGVDYSIHIIQRYREEKGRGADPERAMEKSLTHSGRALVAAACTTAVGFGVLYFAPMNMFSVFGLLTTLMIVYSFMASIIIVPTLLLLGERLRRRR
jgi:hydrophobe/amphiphile efflux-3 (HAE3) family protein